jgi:hypothetical protein
LDTSAASGTVSARASYEAISGYITGGFLRDYLRVGDTFHLIPFSDKPFLDISRRITSRGDAETIIGRMFLHYPLYPRADIPAALSFAEKHVSSLPARPKKIVLVSGGSIRSGFGPAGISEFAETRERLARLNTTLEFMQITPSRNAPVAPPPVQATPEQPTPVPGDTQQIEPDPFYFEPLPDTALYTPDQDLAETVFPEQTEPAASPVATPSAPPTVAPAPTSTPKAEPARTPKPSRTKPPVPKTTAPGIPATSLILWLLALLIPAFFLTAVAGKIKNPGVNAGTSGLLIMNLYVEDQNTYIGRRNIHALKPGYSYTVGGKNSDFRIFVVPVPPRLGKIRSDGKTVTFTPLLPRYFPELGAMKLEDCVGKTIRIISDTHYVLKIRFDVLGTGGKKWGI